MSGILDNRIRIMDTIVTLEGRRQLADGKLNIEYISFTDNSTFYDPDVISGSADPTNRIYFEQCHLPQDQITFEADDSGKLKPFKFSSSNNKEILSGKIVENIQSKKVFSYLTENFSSTAENLLVSSIQNFKNLQTIGTKDYLFEDDGFELGPSTLEFNVTKKYPLSSIDPDLTSRSVDDLPSLFYDESLSNVINFKYLPPINKIEDDSINKSDPTILEQNKIGNYQNLRQNLGTYTPQLLEKDLLKLEKFGFKKTVTFDPTSLKNNLVSQIFEITDVEMKKLDVIDYGIYKYGDEFKHAFFVGKVVVDSFGSQTFIKMFTLVFERGI